MSITSAQGYEMRITRQGDTLADPPQPYWQTVERLLADRGPIISPAFSPMRYVIWTTRKAKRESSPAGMITLQFGKTSNMS
jgi:hypothetical protein